MELSKDTIQTLKKNIKMARRQPHRFIYCAADDSGVPALIIAKRINSEKAKMRKSAQKKQFCEGRLEIMDGKAMALVIEKSNAPKFAKDLKMFFGKKVPELKKLEVLTEEEYSERALATEGFCTTPEIEMAEVSESASAESESSPELNNAQNTVRERMNIFVGQPQDISDQQLKSLFKQAKSCDGETEGNEFGGYMETLKNERNYRSESRTVTATATERMQVAEEAMLRVRSWADELTVDNPETPAQTASMQTEITELLAGLQQTRTEVQRVQAMRA
jgi:hypothetical protein